MKSQKEETPEKPDFQKMGEADWKSLYECLEDEYWQSERQEHGAVYARGAERIWNDYVASKEVDSELLEALKESQYVLNWHLENSRPEDQSGQSDFFNQTANAVIRVKNAIEKAEQCKALG